MYYLFYVIRTVQIINEISKSTVSKILRKKCPGLYFSCILTEHGDSPSKYPYSV